MGLWTALPRFRGDASERTWLYRVAHNTAITYMTRQQPPRQPRADRASCRSCRRPAPRQESTRDRRRTPRRVCGPRSASCRCVDRQIVVLHLEGLSAAEIEAVTGLSAGSIATRLTRARQKLAAIVQRQEERS